MVGMCLHWSPKAPMEAEKSDTTTTVSVGSRTTVQGTTQEVLTSGFGMGPGRHLRYGRVQLLFEFESTFLLNRGPH